MPKLLTIRKQKWVNKFRPEILRGSVLSPNMGVAAHYKEKLDKLITQMLDDVEKHLHRLYDGEAATEFFSEDASVSSQARIITNMLQKKYEALFNSEAAKMADDFADKSNQASSKAVHNSVKELSGGLSIATNAFNGELTDIFKATVAENVALIKSIPQQYLNGVQQAVMRSITGGEGKVTLVAYLQKHKNITYARAKMISLDQTRKAMNNFSKARLQNAGVQEYEWVHVPSNAPREEHVEMNGNIYRFDDPPVIESKSGERGIPGQLVNCRCKMRPIISFIKDPVKEAKNGDQED